MRSALVLVILFGCGVDVLGPDVREELVAHGFTVADGHAFPFGLADCATMPDCLANNASGSYLLFGVPPAPGMPASAAAIDPPTTPAGMSIAWQLDRNEAVLVYGRTPPAARYFSFTPYLYDRATDTGRTTVFASLADPTNNTLLQADSPVALVIASDRAVEARVRAALAGAGWPATAIHTIVISPDLALLGTDAGADTVALLGRVALFDRANAGAAYLEDVPLAVMRLTGPRELGTDRLPAPALASRRSATDERALAPAVAALGAAIETSLGTMPHRELELASYSATTALTHSASCLEDLRDCGGDVNDIAYAGGLTDVAPSSGLPLLAQDAQDYFLIYGVNHEAAGTARYSNVTILDAAKRAGIRSFDSPNMPGSARRYLPDHPDRDTLFVTKISRTCGYDPGCMEIGAEFPGVPFDGAFGFMFRAYLAPDSNVSPDPDALLTEHVIHVTPAP